MTKREQQHRMASKWAHLFATGQVAESRGYVETLRADCEAVGFVRDAFAGVLAAGPLPAPTDHDATRRYLNAISDHQALGNAIYSMWAQVTQWQVNGDLGASDTRLWFATAFSRLVALTRPLGAITAVTITSHNVSRLEPAPTMLRTQTLTLQRTGQATLVNVFASGYRQEQSAPATRALDALFADLAALDADVSPSAGDVGTWTLTLVGEGGCETITGILAEHEALCDRLRALLPFDYLLLLDGAPDRLERLVVDYHPSPLRREKLVVDRHSHTLAFTQRSEATRSRLAVATPEVAELLDDLDEVWLGWSGAGAAPDGALTITARFRYAANEVYQGSLSRDDPIPGWAEQAQRLRAWLATYAPQMLDARLIQRTTPRPGQLLYAQVVFHHGAPAYSYLAAPDYAIGDRVVVPTTYGTTYGTIVAMAYYDPDDAPFPPAATKTILKHADPLVEAEFDFDDD